MNGQVGETTRFEKKQMPLAVAWMNNREFEVETADDIGWDMLVGKGNKHWLEEWKFLQRIYQEFYFEIFQCADPQHCSDCISRGHTNIKLGWAHRSSYCKADAIRIFWGDGEIAQVATVGYKKATDWLWDTYMANNNKGRVIKVITNWDGRCRTLGVAIPLGDMLDGMKLWQEKNATRS